MFLCLLAAETASVPLAPLDFVVLVGTVLASRPSACGSDGARRAPADYFLAGKSVAWWVVAGSIFGTNVSSHHLVGMMGAGLKEGFAQANFEFGAIFGLLMLCYFFLPFYRRMGVYTLSEYLGRRFDDRSRLLYSITNMAFLLIQMCGTLILGALTVETLLAGSRLCHQLQRGRVAVGRRGRGLHDLRRAEGRYLHRLHPKHVAAGRRRHDRRAGHLASRRGRHLGPAGESSPRSFTSSFAAEPSRSFPGAACSAG